MEDLRNNIEIDDRDVRCIVNNNHNGTFYLNTDIEKTVHDKIVNVIIEQVKNNKMSITDVEDIQIYDN